MKRPGRVLEFGAAVVLVVVALVAVPATALAADPQVTSIKIEGPSRLTVGDRFDIVIQTEADAGTKVTLVPSALPLNLSLIGVPDVKASPAGGGRVTTTIRAHVAAFFVGDAQVPPLQLQVRDAGGSVRQVMTPPLSLSVASVLPPSGNVEPRPLKPQAEIARVGTSAWVYGAGGAAMALIVLAAVIRRIWLRRAARVVTVTAISAPEVLGPEDEARLALDRDAASSLAEREYPAFYAAVATTVRRYLTQRFGFPAFALTTVELQARMVARGIDRWQARLVAGLLEQCDAVVFAGYRPAPERADSDLTAAYEIIEISRPPVAAEVAAV